MSAAAALGLAAGVTQAAAYLMYLTQVVRADCRPNGMTWVMWSYGAFVFFAIELHLGAPVSVLVLPGICMLCSIGAASCAFARSAWLRPGRQDWTALAFDATLMFGYAGFVAASTAGRPLEGVGLAFVALAGVSALTSSWPALRSTFAHPGNERPLAWFVWSAAYGLLTLAAMAEGLPWPFLVYPILSQVVSMLIGVFALDGGESSPRREAALSGEASAAETRSIQIT